MFAELNGRSVLITGVGTGLGAAVARVFGRGGAEVGVRFHRSAEAVKQVVAVPNAGAAVVVLRSEVTGKAEVARSAAAHVDVFGRLIVAQEVRVDRFRRYRADAVPRRRELAGGIICLIQNKVDLPFANATVPKSPVGASQANFMGRT